MTRFLKCNSFIKQFLNLKFLDEFKLYFIFCCSIKLDKTKQFFIGFELIVVTKTIEACFGKIARPVEVNIFVLFFIFFQVFSKFILNNLE